MNIAPMTTLTETYCTTVHRTKPTFLSEANYQDKCNKIM